MKDIKSILNLLKKEMINNNECIYLLDQLSDKIAELEELNAQLDIDYDYLNSDFDKLKEKYNDLLETIADIENQYEKEE